MHSVVALLSSSLVGVREGDELTDYLYTTTISIRPVPHAIDRDVVYKVKQPTASRGSTGQQQQQSSRSRDAYREERQGFYRPAVFVDEIGLTSDKYVVLNETVRELPLKISFGPLSLQVRVSHLCYASSRHLPDECCCLSPSHPIRGGCSCPLWRNPSPLSGSWASLPRTWMMSAGKT